mgnify:CR=1 FL=1
MPVIGSHGQRLDLRIKQGASFSLLLTLRNPDGTAVDLTGSIVRAQLRAAIGDATPAAVFAATVVPPNQVRLELSAAQTAALSVTGQQQVYLWDMEIEWPTGCVDSPLYGQAIVKAEVTR